MKMKVVLFLIGMLMVAGVAQARHPKYTRQATAGDPTFDLVVSHYGNPDKLTRDKIENSFSNMTDAVYEMTEGIHRIKTVRIYLNGKNKDECDTARG